MTSPAVKLLGATAATGETDPLTIASWTCAFWGSDPDQTPPSDGGSCTSWRNAGSDGGTFTQTGAGTAPLYRASVAALNSKPALEFQGVGGDGLRFQGSYIGIGFTIVAVYIASTNNRFTYDGYRAAASLSQRSNGWRGNSGNTAEFTGITPSLSTAYYTVMYYNSTPSTYLRVNGADAGPEGAGSGANTREPLTLGASFTDASALQGPLAFCASLDGELSAGELATFESWASDYYGI